MHAAVQLRGQGERRETVGRHGPRTGLQHVDVETDTQVRRPLVAEKLAELRVVVRRQRHVREHAMQLVRKLVPAHLLQFNHGSPESRIICSNFQPHIQIKKSASTISHF